MALFNKSANFEPDYVVRARMQAQQMIQQWLGSVEIDNEGDFLIRNDSTITIAQIFDWEDGDTVFNVFSPVLIEVPITPELLEYAATEFFVLGHMRVVPDESGRTGALQMEYRILANDLDLSELQAAVRTVSGVIEANFEELRQRFGGKSLLE